MERPGPIPDTWRWEPNPGPVSGRPTRKWALMIDPLEVPLDDPVLLEEMDLMTDLIIAASETEAQLPPAVVDWLLGLEASVRPSVSIPRPRESADPNS